MIDLKSLLLAGLLLSVAAGQEEKPKTCPEKVGEGLRATVTSPAIVWHWAATGLGILLCLPLDHQIQERAMKRGLMPESLADFGDAWGGAWAAFTILPGIYLTESLRGTSRDEAFQRLEFTCLSLTAVGSTTYLLKWATGRERPNGASRLSFPSGHTSISFGVAEVVRTLYGNRAGAMLYSMALITGISRIHDNKHYLSDVVAGAGLGIGLVRGFNLAQRSRDRMDALQITMVPGLMMLRIQL